jgi:hypothetical protein
MLKRQFHLQKTLDLKDYIATNVKNINVAERTIVKNIIFHNIIKTRCVYFQYKWDMHPDMKIVSSAMIKIEGIASELRKHKLLDPTSIHLMNHITFIRNTLKEGIYN